MNLWCPRCGRLPVYDQKLKVTTMRTLASTILMATLGLGSNSHADTAKPNARLAPIFQNVLLLHVDGEVSIPMFLEPDGSVYYVDLHLKPGALKENYSRNVKWKMQGDDLCIVKAADDVPCFVLPELKIGEPVDTEVRGVDEHGAAKWKVPGKLMIVAGRPKRAVK